MCLEWIALNLNERSEALEVGAVAKTFLQNAKHEQLLTILKVVQALVRYLELERICEHAWVVEHHHAGHIDGTHAACPACSSFVPIGLFCCMLLQWTEIWSNNV
jgi:hypothetical protein